MWINLDEEEFEVIMEALEHFHLDGLKYLVKMKMLVYSPHNMKLLNKNAYEAARTYFSADDLKINDDFVEWEENGDAWVMAWQKVPKEYIPEEEFDCGCGK